MTGSPERLEIHKNKLAAKLERQKWLYRKEELKYLEAGQHLRALNQIMWQVPGMVMAVTGGLWYGATLISATIPKAGVFLFTCIIDLLTIVVIRRLREIIEKQIVIQRAFAGEDKTSRERDKIVVRCWSAMLGIAALLSLAAIGFATDLTKRVSDTPAPVQCMLDSFVSVDEPLAQPSVSAKHVKPKHFQASKKQCP